jgi:hypothetical protein
MGRSERLTGMRQKEYGQGVELTKRVDDHRRHFLGLDWAHAYCSFTAFTLRRTYRYSIAGSLIIIFYSINPIIWVLTPHSREFVQQY